MGINETICLGDIGGYYCEINECCNTIRDRKIFSLMGNHDWYLVTGEKCTRSNSVNRCIEYQQTLISEENLNWLASLEASAQIGRLSVVHGGWIDPVDEYVVPSSNYFDQFPGQFFASGHTHVPCIWTDGNKTYCNPGSVGQPRDGDPRASFATWDESSFSLYRVEYDFRILERKMDSAGFEPLFYENLSGGTRIGGKIDRLED